MAKTTDVAPLERVLTGCATLEELHEQTRLLYEAITARARLGRRKAGPRKPPAKLKPRKRVLS